MEHGTGLLLTLSQLEFPLPLLILLSLLQFQLVEVHLYQDLPSSLRKQTLLLDLVRAALLLANPKVPSSPPLLDLLSPRSLPLSKLPSQTADPLLLWLSNLLL